MYNKFLKKSLGSRKKIKIKIHSGFIFAFFTTFTISVLFVAMGLTGIIKFSKFEKSSISVNKLNLNYSSTKEKINMSTLKIRGQERAKGKVISAINSWIASKMYGNNPGGIVLVFSGPSGCGKNFMAQAIANGLGIGCIKVDCSLENQYTLYADKRGNIVNDNVNFAYRLLGFEGYDIFDSPVNHDKTYFYQLASFVKNSNVVLVLDKIDHTLNRILPNYTRDRSIFNFLCDLRDYGKSQVADVMYYCDKTVVICNTNSIENFPEDFLRRAIVIEFDKLDWEAYFAIIVDKIDELFKNVYQKFKINFTYDESSLVKTAKVIEENGNVHTIDKHINEMYRIVADHIESLKDKNGKIVVDSASLKRTLHYDIKNNKLEILISDTNAPSDSQSTAISGTT
ncbi:MAG: ATP-binding protein [Firmicutes bacterium]|nr:ATP-binding protein [Bacillota bacterium]